MHLAAPRLYQGEDRESLQLSLIVDEGTWNFPLAKATQTREFHFIK